MLLSGFAYTLFEQLRAHLRGSILAKASPGTLRLKLIKIGAVVTRNTRRLDFRLSEAYPLKQLFAGLLHSLQST